MLLLGLLFGQGERLAGQTFQTIYTFSWASLVNSDGAGPMCTLLLDGGTLYGTAELGGAEGRGTVFKLATDGSGFTVLHHFSTTPDIYPVNADGAMPRSGVTLAGSTLYGTGYTGGTGANGSVFSVSTNGDGFRTLYSFKRFESGANVNADGANPWTDLVLSGDALYGSTFDGGPGRKGRVFHIDTTGSNFGIFYEMTNISGAGPRGALVRSSNVFYGTTIGGGTFGSGTVFRIGTDGTGLTVLYSFTGGPDGSQPLAGVCLSSNVLFGTTSAGGARAQGTVFRANTGGTGFATLHSFADTEGTPNTGSLVLIGDNLFGLAPHWWLGGTLYTLKTDGTGFTVLHTFTGGADGNLPYGGLTASGSTLYGTTSLGGVIGGSEGYGTIFSFSLLPRLAITGSGPNVILSWPTAYAGMDYTRFTLQSTTNLLAPAWTAVPEISSVVNGQNTVTNTISDQQVFYRLER